MIEAAVVLSAVARHWPDFGIILVYAAVARTYFGRTAALVQQAHTVSHFRRAVLKIGDYLIVLAVTLVAIIIAMAIYRGDPILATLQFALVLTVAAIPVAMPAVLSRAWRGAGGC